MIEPLLLLKLLIIKMDKIIFLAFGSVVEVRSITKSNTILLQKWLYSLNERIKAIDTKHTEDEIFLGIGTNNGIIYVTRFPTTERIVFNSHSAQINCLKFHPNQSKNIILSCSRDCTIRMFDIDDSCQLAVYQDPFNNINSFTWVSWHDSGDKFISSCDRCGQDFIHFWNAPWNQIEVTDNIIS